MKKYLLILVCLLFVKNVFARDRNKNWELITYYYYADGTKIKLPTDTFHVVNPSDSILDLQKSLFSKAWENIDDSMFIEKQKRYTDTIKVNKVIRIEYWLKPLREINSNDTFNIEIRKKKFTKNESKNKFEAEVTIDFDLGEMQIIEKKYFTMKEIKKNIQVNGYYFLDNIKIKEEVSINLFDSSSDTTLDDINSCFSNITYYRNSIFGVLPIEYSNFSRFYTMMCRMEPTLFTEFEYMPNFTWSQSKYKMKIDSTYCMRKLITDTINGKVNYGIHKNYLEIPEELICDSKNNSFIFLMSKLRENDYYQYKLVPWLDYEGKDIPWIDGNLNQCYFELKDVPIGKYILYIKSKKSNKESNGYKITILPLWYQTNTFKWIISNLLFILLGLLAFRKYKNSKKKKLLALEKQKSQIDIQLKTVRSQLNPHFIFNALSSIQSLISKTDYEKANEYLIDFSQLLRKPLNQENIATWNLNDEIELLKTYIKLEQLRTNFQFDFTIDENINVHTISFPAMLLQPIVENAIKHGFSNSEQGELFIHIDKDNRTIIITIEDNGNSFDCNQYKAGNGLALTKDYIELVNKQYPHSFVSMNFDTTNETTKCIFTFKNWIDE